MDRIAVAAPSLPPKTKPRSRSPPPAPDSSTVPPKTVTPSVSRIDVFHKSNSFSEQSHTKTHVVKILICPQNGNETNVNLCQDLCIKNQQTDSDNCDVTPFIRISVNSGMIQNDIMAETTHETPNSYFDYGPFNCGTVSSGQISPSNTLDSGTCSDLDSTPPPLPKRNTGGISVTLIGSHTRPPSCSSGAEIDSDGNESSISCDSLNNDKITQVECPASPTKSLFLPQTLLQDIRQRNTKLTSTDRTTIIDEKSYEERKKEETQEKDEVKYNTDMFYKFHINEHLNNGALKLKPVAVEDESFAGYKDLLSDGAATIRSAKGTVRGVKNRVRAGIATFLQINTTEKNYKEKEAGKVVVYTTTMGVLRDTYQACMKVKQILRTLLVKFEERDVFMSTEYQEEIQERMHCNHILVPQVFVDGQHIGDAETIEILNETGELRRILKPFQSMDVCTTCKVCGGYRLLPCQICKGSKKSVHRNHFTTEFVALKCMNCDEVGLVRCSSC